MALRYGELKVCSKCGAVKPLTSEYFPAEKRKKCGFKSECKSCHVTQTLARRKSSSGKQKHREANKRYADNHREWYREYNKLWKQRNSKSVARYNAGQRALKRVAQVEEITEDDIAVLWEGQNGECSYCESGLDSDYHIDHMVPLSRGGAHTRGNLALTCPHCNLSKHDKTPAEFSEYKESLAEAVQ